MLYEMTKTVIAVYVFEAAVKGTNIFAQAFIHRRARLVCRHGENVNRLFYLPRSCASRVFVVALPKKPIIMAMFSAGSIT